MHFAFGSLENNKPTYYRHFILKCDVFVLLLPEIVNEIIGTLIEIIERNFQMIAFILQNEKHTVVTVHRTLTLSQYMYVVLSSMLHTLCCKYFTP